MRQLDTSLEVETSYLEIVYNLRHVEGAEVGTQSEFMERLEAARGLDGEELAYLGHLYEQGAKWSQRARVYERQIDASTTDETRIELLLAMGQLQQELLDDADGARETYTRLLETDPENAQALAGLQQIAESTGDIGGLIALLNNELANTEDEVALCNIHLRLGRLRSEEGTPRSS